MPILQAHAHAWRNPTVARHSAETPPALCVAATGKLPLDTDLSALVAKDRTLLRTLRTQCEVRGLYLVHNGREIKIAPVLEPGWRLIVETA